MQREFSEKIRNDAARLAVFLEERNAARGDLARLAEDLSRLSALWALLPQTVRQCLQRYLKGDAGK